MLAKTATNSVGIAATSEKKNTRLTCRRAVVPPARRIARRRPNSTTSVSAGISVPTSIAAACPEGTSLPGSGSPVSARYELASMTMSAAAATISSQK